jgi:hypothetical protein
MLRLQEVQTVALFGLASKGLIDQSGLAEHDVVLIEKGVTDELSALLITQTSEEKEVVSYLATELSRIPVDGPNGLKSRTGLLEHRYDPV